MSSVGLTSSPRRLRPERPASVSLGVDVVYRRFPPGEAAVPGFAGHLVSLHLGPPTRGLFRVDGRPVEMTEMPGNVMIVPSGLPAYQALTDPSEAVNVLVPDRVLLRMAEEIGVDRTQVEVLHRAEARDSEIERIVRSFLAELRTPGLGGALYAEALTNQLAVHLLRGHAMLGPRGRRRLDGTPAHRLTRAEVDRAIAYIEDHLTHDLTLAGIAAEIALSPRHLSRLFKEATGLPPHRFVIRRRVERAQDLLLAGDLPLPVVAQAVGFFDQSHLTRHVKTLLGATPDQIRRAGRNVQGTVQNIQDDAPSPTLR